MIVTCSEFLLFDEFDDDELSDDESVEEKVVDDGDRSRF